MLSGNGVKYANVTNAYCDITDTAGDGLADWYKEKPMVNKIDPVVPREIYYVTGSESITGYNWADGFADGNYGRLLSETETAKVYAATVYAVPAGSYEFKITQDPERFAWDHAIGTEEGGNFNLVPQKTSNVVITLNLNETGNKRIAISIYDSQLIQKLAISWKKNAGSGDKVFTANFPVSVMNGVKLDSTVLDEKNYTLEGNTVTLKAAYLETLSKGEHTLSALLTNAGPVSAKFSVSAKNTSSPSGSTSSNTPSSAASSGANSVLSQNAGESAPNPSTGDTDFLPFAFIFSGAAATYIAGTLTVRRFGKSKN